jgi:hypothetical protein
MSSSMIDNKKRPTAIEKMRPQPSIINYLNAHLVSFYEDDMMRLLTPRSLNFFFGSNTQLGPWANRRHSLVTRVEAATMRSHVMRWQNSATS